MGSPLNGREWQMLADHVAPYPFDPESPSQYVSTFNAALRDARVVCGRDVSTGAFTGVTPNALWAGTLVYFALLDQVGDTLKPAGGRKIARESSVERALRFFSPGTTRRQRQALYGLRNAFAHEFGLINVNRKRPEYTHAFAVDDSAGGPLVRWPSRRWDGHLSSLKPGSRTVVSLPVFGDTCEEVVRSVRVHALKSTLRSVVPVSELQRRYSFRITPAL